MKGGGMKKIIFLMLMLATMVVNATDISGKYIADKVMENGKIKKAIDFTVTFKKDGTLLMMGNKAGTWKYINKDNIVIHSVFDEKKGERDKIIKCDDSELILESSPHNRMYYKRVK